MEIVGYARVSTQGQKLDLQIDALKKAGCTIIFEEKVSGIKLRPELDKALSYLREGDVLVIWKLDRLARSLKELISIIDMLNKRNIAFKSISDGIDTNSALGRCQFGIFASLAEYEREILIERTREGLKAARERGKLGGRPSGLSKEARRKAKAAKALYLSGDYTVDGICSLLNIGSKATLYRYLKFEGVNLRKTTLGK